MIHWSGTFFYLSLVIIPEITSPGYISSGRLCFKAGELIQAGSLAMTTQPHDQLLQQGIPISTVSWQIIFCISLYKDHQKLPEC